MGVGKYVGKYITDQETEQELIHHHSFPWKKVDSVSVAGDEGKAIVNQIVIFIFQNLFAD